MDLGWDGMRLEPAGPEASKLIRVEVLRDNSRNERY